MCRYTDALVNLVPLVLGLHDQLKKAVQDSDVETSHGICRIAVAMGETHSRCVHMQTNTSVPVGGVSELRPLVFKGSFGTGGALARVSGFGQHDSFLHGCPWTLPSQRDHQLSDPHLLVQPAGPIDLEYEC